MIRKLKRWFKPENKTFKDNINAAIFHLNASAKKLRRNAVALKRKDKTLFDRCIELRINNHSHRALLYANECAELRRLAQLVMSSELALEQAIVRLQTISELSDVMGTVLPILGIVENTKARLLGIIPSVSEQLGEVTGMLQSTIGDMGSVPIEPTTHTSRLSFEAEKILEEVDDAAEEKLRDRFPELPTELYHSDPELRVPVALTATGESLLFDESSLISNVYNYIRERNGELSVLKCASNLGVHPTDVEQAILKLKDEGKIILE